MLAACWLLQSGVAAWVSTDAADGKEGVGRQVCSGATGLDWTGAVDEMVGCPPFFFCLWSVALSVALKRMGPFRRCSATRPRTRWGVGTHWFTGATAADGTPKPSRHARATEAKARRSWTRGRRSDSDAQRWNQREREEVQRVNERRITQGNWR